MGAKLPFAACKENDNFIFVSYGHANSDAVYATLSAMNQCGYRIWYDDGINPGGSWTDEIANRISSCSLFLIFCTKESVESPNVNAEILWAVKKNREILAIRLDDSEFPPGVELYLHGRQGIFKYELSPEDFWRRLDTALEKFPHTKSFTNSTTLLEHFRSATSGGVKVEPANGNETDAYPAGETGLKLQPPTAEDNPFLSEFGDDNIVFRWLRKIPYLRRVLPTPQWRDGFPLVLLMIAMSAFGLIASFFSGAGANTIHLSLPGTSEKRELTFGWLSEMNGALFYLIGAPIYFHLGFKFVDALRLTWRELSSGRPGNARLLSQTGAQPQAVSARQNKRFFSNYSLAGLFLLVAYLVYGTESKDFRGLAFGWVQTPFLQEYVGKTIGALDRRVNPIETLTRGTHGEVYDQKDWKIDSVDGAPYCAWLFWPFLLCALTMQAIFLAFSMWLIAKVIFFVSTVVWLVISDQDATTKPIELFLRPDYGDTQRRFGLKSLDRVYNSIVVFVFCAGIGAHLSRMANLAKGSYSIEYAPGHATERAVVMGQAFIFAAPILLISFLAVFIGVYNAVLRASGTRRNHENVSEQTAWPSSNILDLWKTNFGKTLIFILAMYAFGAYTVVFPGPIQALGRGWHWMVVTLYRVFGYSI